jgi:hypothetical protein
MVLEQVTQLSEETQSSERSFPSVLPKCGLVRMRQARFPKPHVSYFVQWDTADHMMRLYFQPINLPRFWSSLQVILK